MCMEDIRLGRKTAGYVKGVAVAANSTVTVAEQDLRRTSLTISNDGSTLIRLTPLGVSNLVGFGIALNTGTPFITMTVEQFGTLVGMAWQVTVGVGGCNVTVVEATLEKE